MPPVDPTGKATPGLDQRQNKVRVLLGQLRMKQLGRSVLGSPGSGVIVDLDEPHGAPLHIRLAHGLRDAIRLGRLEPGTKLLPSRVFAEELGCSRWVVTEAYEQLQQEGWVTSRVGSGTRVRSHAHARGGSVPDSRYGADTDGGVIDLRPGLPDLAAFPHQLWLSALQAASSAVRDRDLGL